MALMLYASTLCQDAAWHARTITDEAGTPTSGLGQERALEVPPLRVQHHCDKITCFAEPTSRSANTAHVALHSTRPPTCASSAAHSRARLAARRVLPRPSSKPPRTALFRAARTRSRTLSPASPLPGHQVATVLRRAAGAFGHAKAEVVGVQPRLRPKPDRPDELAPSMAEALGCVALAQAQAVVAQVRAAPPRPPVGALAPLRHRT